MLRRDTHMARDIIRVFAKFFDDSRHFDRLRSSTNHTKNAQHLFGSLYLLLMDTLDRSAKEVSSFSFGVSERCRQRLCGPAQEVDCRTNLWLVWEVPAVEQRLRVPHELE